MTFLGFSKQRESMSPQKKVYTGKRKLIKFRKRNIFQTLSILIRSWVTKFSEYLGLLSIPSWVNFYCQGFHHSFHDTGRKWKSPKFRLVLALDSCNWVPSDPPLINGAVSHLCHLHLSGSLKWKSFQRSNRVTYARPTIINGLRLTSSFNSVNPPRMKSSHLL